MDILDEIAGLNDGKVYQDGNDALALVIDRVMATGGRGAVTIKLEVTREISEGVLVPVLSAVAAPSTLPKRKPVGRLRFRGKDGELTNHKPGQQELPNLQAVETGHVEPHTITVGQPVAREV